MTISKTKWRERGDISNKDHKVESSGVGERGGRERERELIEEEDSEGDFGRLPGLKVAKMERKGEGNSLGPWPSNCCRSCSTSSGLLFCIWAAS